MVGGSNSPSQSIASAPLEGLDVVLYHLLTVVLQQPSNSPIYLALKENFVNDINTLVFMVYDDINKLCFTNRNNSQQRLSIGHTVKLRLIQHYIQHMASMGSPIDDYLQLKKEDIKTFARSLYNPYDPANYDDINPTFLNTSTSTLSSDSQLDDPVLVEGDATLGIFGEPRDHHNHNNSDMVMISNKSHNKKCSFLSSIDLELHNNKRLRGNDTIKLFD